MYVKFRAVYDGTTWNAEAEDVDIFVIGTSIRNLMQNVEVAANDFFRDLLPGGEKLHIVVVNESAAGAMSVPPSAGLTALNSTL